MLINVREEKDGRMRFEIQKAAWLKIGQNNNFGEFIMDDDKLNEILIELKKITSFIDEIKQQKQLGSSLVEEQAEACEKIANS